MSNKTTEEGNHTENVAMRLKEIMLAARMTSVSHTGITSSKMSHGSPPQGKPKNKTRLDEEDKNIGKESVLTEAMLKIKEQRDRQADTEKTKKLQNQLGYLRSTKSDNPITDTIRLAACPQAKFSSANSDYIPYKRTWRFTLGK